MINVWPDLDPPTPLAKNTFECVCEAVSEKDKLKKEVLPECGWHYALGRGPGQHGETQPTGILFSLLPVHQQVRVVSHPPLSCKHDALS